MQKLDILFIMIGLTLRILVGCKGWDDPNPAAFQPGAWRTLRQPRRRLRKQDVLRPRARPAARPAGIIGDRDAGPIVIVTKPQRQAP
jgi:hypothetical protein